MKQGRKKPSQGSSVPLGTGGARQQHLYRWVTAEGLDSVNHNSLVFTVHMLTHTDV